MPTSQAKAASIKAIEGLDLPDPVVNRIVTLPAASWERVAAEIQVVLERAMREEIRENNLADERRKVAARVRLDLPDEDATVVSEVVQDLLVPNSFFNAQRTEQRRRRSAAGRGAGHRDDGAQRGHPARGRHCQRRGRRNAAGARPAAARRWSWADLRGAVGFVLVLGLVFLYYLWRMEPQLWLRAREHRAPARW